METAASNRLPLLVEVRGRSMEPTLPEGSTVWVDESAHAALPGDVVLIKGRSGWIVHRIVWRSRVRGRDRVFHRGDCEGGIGVCELAAVRGRVLSIVAPGQSPIPELDDLPVGFRRRFRWAQKRCRLFVFGAAIAPEWCPRWSRRLGGRLLGARGFGSTGRG